MEALYNMMEGFHHRSSSLNMAMKIVTAAITFVTNSMENCNTHQFIYDITIFTFKTQSSLLILIANFCINIDKIIINIGGLI